MTPYYDESGITIFLGDCLEIMKSIPDGSVDCVCADPPYGRTSCAWDSVIPFAPMWEQVQRIIKPKGAIVLFGSQPFTSALVMSNPGMFRYEWVWEKSGGTGFLDANRKPLRCHENIMVFATGNTTYNPQKRQGISNHTRIPAAYGLTSSLYRGSYDSPPADVSGMKYPRSVMKFPKHPANETLHPTQKPVALMDYLVKTYTNAGDTVLDFSMGSGTTLVAAKHLGRRAIGIEISEKYIEIAIKRLQQEVFDFDEVRA